MNDRHEAIVSNFQNDSDLGVYTIIGRKSNTDKAVRVMPWIQKARNNFTAPSKKDDMIDTVSKVWELLGKMIDLSGWVTGWIR